MAVVASEVQKAYLAYFGRPADPAGLTYWQNATAVDAMRVGFAGSAEYGSLYTGMNSSERVNQVYQNILGRSAEAAGLTYWAAKLDAGTLTVADLAWTIINAAQNEDAVTVQNRLTYAGAFTAAIDTPDEIAGYSGDPAAAAARAAVLPVTTSASLASAQAAIATTIVSVTGHGAATGQTISGTAGDDTLTGGLGADTINGLSGDDTIVFLANHAVAGETITKTSGTATIDVRGDNDFSNVIFNLPDSDQVLKIGADVTVTFNNNPFGNKPFDMVIAPSAGTAQHVILKGTSANEVFSIDHFVVGGLDSLDSLRFEGGGGSDTLSFSGNRMGNSIDAVTHTVTFEVTGSISSATFSNGFDKFIGGSGNDTFFASTVAETFTGGAGNDNFKFNYATPNASPSTVAAMDLITDFNVTQDHLYFSNISASGQQAAVQIAVSALGSGATASQIATAMANANTTDFSICFATLGGNTYVLQELSNADNNATTVGVFVELVGVASGFTYASNVGVS